MTFKVTARERGWHKDNKDSNGKVLVNDEDVRAEILNQDFFKVQCHDIVFLITVKLILWLQTATCERGFSLRTLIKTRNRSSMGNTLLDILMMISSNGPDLQDEKVISDLCGESIQLFKAHLQRFPNRSSAGIQRRQRRSEVEDVVKVLAGGHADAIFNDKNVASSDEEDSQESDTGGVIIPRPQPVDHAAVARAQAAALDSVGNYVANAGMNAMPWPETHFPPRKAAKEKTVHVTESVS